MNRKAIWLIIGLMTAALIGSVLLQLYWINWSVQLNREQFNNNLIAAMNNIARGVEQIDEDIIYNEARQMLVADVGESLSKKELLARLHDEKALECNCSECQARAIAANQKIYLGIIERNNIPIEERLPDIKTFTKLIDQKLKEQGITLGYNYGVYSVEKKGFVLRNGHYMVNNVEQQSVSSGNDQLLNTNFRVNLFSNGMRRPPGFLAIYFPNLTTTIWKSAWKTMLAALIFTAIILFCFAYTVQVIFFQKKVSEMKTDFINNMTHEFKTPIATISLAADSITSPMISGNVDKVNRFADIIKQENKRMLSQVEKVLQMAQIDKQNFQLNITKFDLHEVINQAVRHTNLQVEKKGGSVDSKLSASKTMIEADRTHISNIIHNLLDNANKYSPERPKILVSTRNFPNGIEITIKDHGIGMSKEALKHIFDKFFRVHTGNIHDVKGFGLGLSYVKAMVTAHQGSIDVRSDLGKGSSFSFFLPFKQKI